MQSVDLALESVRVLTRMRYRGVQEINVFCIPDYRGYCLQIYMPDRTLSLSISEDELIYTSPNTVACQLMARLDLLLDRKTPGLDVTKAPLRTIEI